MLKVGALGGLSLSQVLRARANGGTRLEKLSGIFVFLEGGRSHQDSFDL